MSEDGWGSRPPEAGQRYDKRENVNTSTTTTTEGLDTAARAQQPAVDINSEPNTHTHLQNMGTRTTAVDNVRQLPSIAADGAGIHSLLDAAAGSSPGELEDTAARILDIVQHNRPSTTYDHEVAVALLNTGATDAEVVVELVERINHPTDEVREEQARELLRRALTVAASGIRRSNFSPFQPGLNTAPLDLQPLARPHGASSSSDKSLGAAAATLEGGFGGKPDEQLAARIAEDAADDVRVERKLAFERVEADARAQLVQAEKIIISYARPSMLQEAMRKASTATALAGGDVFVACQAVQQSFHELGDTFYLPAAVNAFTSSLSTAPSVAAAWATAVQQNMREGVEMPKAPPRPTTPDVARSLRVGSPAVASLHGGETAVETPVVKVYQLLAATPVVSWYKPSLDPQRDGATGPLPLSWSQVIDAAPSSKSGAKAEPLAGRSLTRRVNFPAHSDAASEAGGHFRHQHHPLVVDLATHYVHVLARRLSSLDHVPSAAQVQGLRRAAGVETLQILLNACTSAPVLQRHIGNVLMDENSVDPHAGIHAVLLRLERACLPSNSAKKHVTWTLKKWTTGSAMAYLKRLVECAQLQVPTAEADAHALHKFMADVLIAREEFVARHGRHEALTWLINNVINKINTFPSAQDVIQFLENTDYYGEWAIDQPGVTGASSVQGGGGGADASIAALTAKVAQLTTQLEQRASTLGERETAALQRWSNTRIYNVDAMSAAGVLPEGFEAGTFFTAASLGDRAEFDLSGGRGAPCSCCHLNTVKFGGSKPNIDLTNVTRVLGFELQQRASKSLQPGEILAHYREKCPELPEYVESHCKARAAEFLMDEEALGNLIKQHRQAAGYVGGGGKGGGGKGGGGYRGGYGGGRGGWGSGGR